jgi:hypothetical protein
MPTAYINGKTGITSSTSFIQGTPACTLYLVTPRQAANNNYPMIVTDVRLRMGGNGGARTPTVSLGGSSDAVSVSSAGSANQDPNADISRYFSNAGATSVGFNSSGGSCYFARSSMSGNTITGFDPTYGTNMTLYGQYDYQEVPAAPAAPSLSLIGPDTVTVTWVAPDNGGAAINGYRIEWSLAADFSSIAGTANVGVVLSYAVTGLTPGTRYYFRVAAKNVVSDTASTTGRFSSSANTTTLAGGKVAVGGVWKARNRKIAVSAAWKPVTRKIAVGATPETRAWKAIL